MTGPCSRPGGPYTSGSTGFLSFINNRLLSGTCSSRPRCCSPAPPVPALPASRLHCVRAPWPRYVAPQPLRAWFPPDIAHLLSPFTLHSCFFLCLHAKRLLVREHPQWGNRDF